MTSAAGTSRELPGHIKLASDRKQSAQLLFCFLLAELTLVALADMYLPWELAFSLLTTFVICLNIPCDLACWWFCGGNGD